MRLNLRNCCATASIKTMFGQLIVIYVIFALILVKLFGQKSGRPKAKRVLVVTAHPDDECMFFGPTVISKPASEQLFLLCLSIGDFYGDGKLRQKELDRACHELDINRLEVESDELFQDIPDQWWDPQKVAQTVSEVVEKHDIDCLITFDDYGISGHLNHRSIYRALPLLRQRLPGLKIYCLQSITIVRKYLSFLELPITILLCCASRIGFQLNAISVSNYLKLLKALHKHKSQMLWFRHLYCVSSRYMFVNLLLPFDHC